MRKRIVLTGSTGALGSWVLNKLKTLNYDLVALTRGNAISAQREGVEFVYADITLPDLGSEEAIARLREADVVIHMAADVRWNQPSEAAKLVNTTGTQHLLEHLASGTTRLQRFVHVSTAFVENPGLATHDHTEKRAPRSFNNTYEHSKWEAERCVMQSGLPCVIVRPSLIVGNRDNGDIQRYNGIYHLLKAHTLGMAPFIVGHADAVIDLIPVDVVSDAVLAALSCNVGETLWAISGSNAPTVQQLFDIAHREITSFRRQRNMQPLDKSTIINPELYNRLYAPLMKPEVRPSYSRFIEYLNVFQPYISIQSRFAVGSASNYFLAPKFEKYFDKCVRSWCEKNERIALAKPYQWKL